MNGVFPTSKEAKLRHKRGQLAERNWLAEGKQFLRKDDLINALSSFRNALRQNVRDVDAHLGLAQALQRQQSRHAAWVAYRAALRFAKQQGRPKEELQDLQNSISQLRHEMDFAYLRLGYTHLTNAVYRHDAARLRHFLAQGEDVNGKDSYQTTPLLAAARHGHLDLCEILVAEGADVNLCGVRQQSPLMEAVAGKSEAIVELLLAQGAEPRHVADGRHTALWEAIFTVNSPAMVRRLLAAGVSASEAYDSGETALLLAAHYDRREIIDILLNAFADPRACTRDQNTLLHLASYHRDVELARRLLLLGLDVNAGNSYGQTPLIQAAEQDCLELVQLLLAHGADVSKKTQYGASALQAARRHQHPNDVEMRMQSPLVKLLLEAGATD